MRHSAVQGGVCYQPASALKEGFVVDADSAGSFLKPASLSLNAHPPGLNFEPCPNLCFVQRLCM